MKQESNNKEATAAFTVTRNDAGQVRLELVGALTYESLGSIWNPCLHAIRRAQPKTLAIDAQQVTSCDGAGIGLLTFLLAMAKKENVVAEIIHLRPELHARLERFGQSGETEIPSAPVQFGAIATLGKVSADLFADVRAQIAFFAQVLLAGVWLVFHPWRFRWKDFFKTIELAGFGAVGIISLLGFLFGLIIAFSSTMPLRQFGVEIYVADLVAIAMVRVLGPFITAVIVAGRTGSSYAAEIGTMKINNEIDALEVMNMDPVLFLGMPRILTTVLVVPLLVVIANLWGLIGSGLVIRSLGYPLTTYLSHVKSVLTVTDVLVGICKGVVYGGLVGMVGCLRGLQTRLGAGAVGIATTRAVVTAIILLVVTEGIFSVLLYFWGI